ncbi:MAG: arylsulfotransferase family protein [Alphaproteobacteria bacterium]
MQGREFKVIMVFLFGLVMFMYGALSTGLQIFPYQHMQPYLAISSSLYGASNIEEYNTEIRWARVAPAKGGLVTHVAEQVQDGVIVYVSTHDTAAYVIDHEGNELHSWSYNFSDIWPDQEHVISLRTLEDRYFYNRDFHVYENGDILLMATVAGVTPWGMGLVKLDKDSNLLWSYTGYPNNDFEVAPDGTIYVIDHKIRHEDLENNEIPTIPFLEDTIVILDPDGKEIKSISLMDAVDRSVFRDMFKDIPDADEGDPTHSNSLTYFTHDHPSISWIKEGYVMVSIRNINALAVIDPKSEEIVHAYRLQTKMQHDLDYLPNGNFMVFDNRGSYTQGGYTRVFEFDPVTQEIYWLYDPVPGESDIEFESEFWGAQQRFDNGNTMIVHADIGRLIEVTPASDIVWDYRIPHIQERDGQDYIATITSAEKIVTKNYPFLSK